MKEVGLLIDLYQPSTQEEGILRQAAVDFFIPLIKFIKVNKKMKVSLSVPLSTLELLDKYGFGSLISDIKYLYDAERVELVGSAAYNPLLTEFPAKVIENQIILNEYALGYYMGAKQGFEGEPSIVVKDIDGFVPTMLAVNNSVLDTLEGLGYKWVLVDDCCLPEELKSSGASVFKFEEKDLSIVRVSGELENLVDQFPEKSFDEIKPMFLSAMSSSEGGIVLRIFDKLEDELVTGYFKKKFEFVELLFEALESKGVVINNVTNIVKSGKKGCTNKEVEISGVSSTVNQIYNAESNKLTKLLKELEKDCVGGFSAVNYDYDKDDYSTVPIWKKEDTSHIEDNILHNIVCSSMLFSKLICFDKYIYSYLLNSEKYNQDRPKVFLKKYVPLVTELVKYVPDESFTKSVMSKVDELSNILK